MSNRFESLLQFVVNLILGTSEQSAHKETATWVWSTQHYLLRAIESKRASKSVTGFRTDVHWC